MYSEDAQQSLQLNQAFRVSFFLLPLLMNLELATTSTEQIRTTTLLGDVTITIMQGGRGHPGN